MVINCIMIIIAINSYIMYNSRHIRKKANKLNYLVQKYNNSIYLKKLVNTQCWLSSNYVFQHVKVK